MAGRRRGLLPAIIAAGILLLAAPGLLPPAAGAAETVSGGVMDSTSPTLPAGAVTVAPAKDLDDYDDTPASVIPDPLERWNRFWFAFNDIFFIHIARPVYEKWEAVVPRPIRNAGRNLWHNVRFPVRFANNVLQGRPRGALVEFTRFCINVTCGFGLANVGDTKKTAVPMDPDGEDFGQTLGVWGVGHGIYLVWPFLGPSSLRETAGFLGDYALSPTAYAEPWSATWGGVAGLRFNALSDVLPAYTTMRDMAVDPYIAVREAYIRRRDQQVRR